MKFKVGDWVRIIDGSDLREETIHKLDEEKLYLVEQLYRDSVKLWEPREGEWCWFWNKGASKPTIGKFENKRNNKIYNMQDSIYYYDYCEPFIGELPSFLRGKR